MKFSFLLMLALACPQRSAAPAPAMTAADAAAPRIILPDHSAVIVEVASDDATRGLRFRGCCSGVGYYRELSGARPEGTRLRLRAPLSRIVCGRCRKLSLSPPAGRGPG